MNRWVHALFGLGTLGSLAVATQTQTLSELGQIRQLNQTEAITDAIASVAETRYRRGCLLLSGGQYPKFHFPTLVPGSTPTNRQTGTKLPPGTPVCDASGATGLISPNGTITDVAVTGNRSVVAQQVARFRGGQFTQPILGGD
jgi:hypothetical protein